MTPDAADAILPDTESRSLPFTVTPAQSVEHLENVLRLRHKAYDRHAYTDTLKAEMLHPDEVDLQGHAVTLVAWCQSERRLLGTVRIASNLDAPIDFPPGLEDCECLKGAYAYFDRFAVETGPQAELVARALVKAAWLWSRGRDARWVVVLGRPAAARRYKRAYGLTLQGDPQGVAMLNYHSEPYVLLGAELNDAKLRVEMLNPAFGDLVSTVQREINVNARGLAWQALAASKGHPLG